MSFLYHPKLLRIASMWTRAQAAFRRRNAAVREASRQRAAFYQHVWRDAAARLGAEIVEIGDGIYKIVRDEFHTKVCGNYTPIDDPVTLALAGNKKSVYRLLAENGLPVARHEVFSPDRFQLARDFLRNAAGPCVVKPAHDTGAGQGVATGITTEYRLALATASAAAYCPELIIEDEIAGGNYRLLYLDGVLLDAVLRRPPAISGNGCSTIRELVKLENDRRIARGYKAAQVLLSIDGEMRRTLASQGFSSTRSVPSAGCKVVLKTVINENSALENVRYTDRICKSIVEDCARAARCVGARFAGVDVVTQDPSKPLVETGGVILEVNTTPGFYYHYYRQGEAYPVAIRVLQRFFQNIHGAGHYARGTSINSLAPELALGAFCQR
jgi:D-alanine-D-alanine ligase-like ATP-grasp enzyme